MGMLAGSKRTVSVHVDVLCEGVCVFFGKRSKGLLCKSSLNSKGCFVKEPCFCRALLQMGPSQAFAGLFATETWPFMEPANSCKHVKGSTHLCD